MNKKLLLTLICFAVLLVPSAALAQTSQFTYQGRLTDGAVVATGTYQMQFSLWDSAVGGTQQGATITNNNVGVTNGIFTVNLDFGAANLTGANRFLEIAVKKPAEADFTTLAPRTQLASSPYAVKTLSATTADGLSNLCVGCVDNAKIASVSTDKVTGTLPINKGGTGSSTKNFVDLTTNQTIEGNKTFGGNIALNTSGFRLKDINDNGHEIFYNSTIDGLEFRGFAGFTWRTGLSGSNERMRMLANGNLGINTDNPEAKLDVNGDVRVNGNVRLAGNGSLFATSGEENLRIVRGTIRIENGNATVSAGAGFTVERFSAGRYRINYNQSFVGTPAVALTPLSNTFRTAVITNNGFAGTNFDVYSTPGIYFDPDFIYVIVVGPR